MDKVPYKVHGFVCTNNRYGERKSCADSGISEPLRKQLKARLQEKGWWGKEVRISSSGCLGLCAQGPNIVLYPSGKVFSGLTVEDADRIMEEIAKLVEAD